MQSRKVKFAEVHKTQSLTSFWSVNNPHRWNEKPFLHIDTKRRRARSAVQDQTITHAQPPLTNLWLNGECSQNDRCMHMERLGEATFAGSKYPCRNGMHQNKKQKIPKRIGGAVCLLLTSIDGRKWNGKHQIYSEGHPSRIGKASLLMSLTSIDLEKQNE